MYASWVSDDDSNLYATLGVYEDASAADVKRAYRDLARIYHPDRNHPTEELGQVSGPPSSVTSVVMLKDSPTTVYHTAIASLQSGGADYEEFLAVKQAYEVLIDEKSRKVYDSCRQTPEFQFRRNRYSTHVASGMVDELIRRCVPIWIYIHSFLQLQQRRSSWIA